MIPAIVSTYPLNQPIPGPNAFVTQVKVVPQSHPARPDAPGGLTFALVVLAKAADADARREAMKVLRH